MKYVMLKHQEGEQAQDGEISELKAMVQTLMGQVKVKETASGSMPEASGGGGRNTPPPPQRRRERAPGGGGDPDHEGEGSG